MFIGLTMIGRSLGSARVQGIYHEKRDRMNGKRRLAIVLAGAMLFGQTLTSLGCSSVINAKTIETFTIYRGKSAALTVKQKGKKMKTGNKYLYKVSNKKIATISTKGKVKGKKAGTTKVILQKKSNKKKTRITIKVVDYVKELRLSSATSVLLQSGQKKSLQATVYPKAAKSRKVEYISSNKSIVSVDSKGTVQAIQSGFATITVKTKGITKKGKKISKKIQIYVTEDTPSVPPTSIPTPYVPDGGAMIIGGNTPQDNATPTPGATGTPGSTATPGASARPEPTVTPTLSPTEPPKTLEDAIKEIPVPNSSTLIAATFVVQDTNKQTSTLYFINRNYQGTMHVSVDGMDMSSNSGVTNVLHKLASEVTGQGVTISINPGNKRENQYYDEKLGIWRDALVVSRPTLSDAWLITNRKNGQQYRLMAWEKDQKYGTPYGLIITDGDTTSKIVVY